LRCEARLELEKLPHWCNTLVCAVERSRVVVPAVEEIKNKEPAQRFRAERIVGVLKQAELGVSLVEGWSRGSEDWCNVIDSLRSFSDWNLRTQLRVSYRGFCGLADA